MNIDELKFDTQGLIPAIVQDADTGRVLMMAWMNREALEKTLRDGDICFYSRSRQRLWTKGETSGNFLRLINILSDCDNDCLLIKARPAGAACHTGADTCWDEDNRTDGIAFLGFLERYLQKRRHDPPEESYTARLLSKGINKVAQKVGEEAVELIIEAKDDDRNLFLNEAADLVYHLIVLLMAKGYTLGDVARVLENRHINTRSPSNQL